MLALKKTSSPTRPCKGTTNILPCRVHHDGPIKVTKRYWSPQDENGVVARSTEQYLPQPVVKGGPKFTAVDEDIEIEEEEEEPPEPVRILETVSTFDDVIVWGHDRIPNQDDTFVKGIEEWISFAEAMHGTTPTELHKPQQTTANTEP
ncbi:hypothetical protein LTS15_005222 [Exophiala xenobiotica]|nr:hypothetical protein LTS15_005222 [Exophiala xenobiotica]